MKQIINSVIYLKHIVDSYIAQLIRYALREFAGNCAVWEFFSHNAYNLALKRKKNVSNLLHFRIPLNADNFCFIIWCVVRRIALYEISSRNIFGAL